MRQRCRNPRCAAYPNYGGRGIYVTAEWDDFWVFVADMGDRPEGHSIDRIDNDGPYAPWNCRWADRSTQNNNTRPTHYLPRIYESSRGWTLKIKEKTVQVFKDEQSAVAALKILLQTGVTIHRKGCVSKVGNLWTLRQKKEYLGSWKTREDALAAQSMLTEIKDWQHLLCSCAKCKGLKLKS